jgi:PAS domain S-box-containing protein
LNVKRFADVNSAIRNPSNKTVLVLALFALYSLGFRVLYPTYMNTNRAFVFGVMLAIPVLAVAAWFGLKAGLFAWLVSAPLELLLLAGQNEAALQVMVEQGGFLALGVLLIGLIPAGRLHDVSRRMEREAAKRLKVEKDLRDSQHFVEQVMEHIPDIVYIHDLNENRSIYTNHVVASVLGYTPEAIKAMGSSIDENLLHPDDLATTRPDIKARLNAAKPREIVEAEYRAKHADGGWRWFFTQEVVFARNADGTVRQLLGIAQDITERKQAGKSEIEQEKLELALEKERELSALKNRLMITLSHEFRTPLSVILASGELLERYFDRLTPTRRAECLATIKTSIIHLREMLDDITTMIGQGDFVPRFNPSPMDLEAFCRQMTEEFQASLGTAYTINYTASGDLDDIAVDSDLLRPILKNVLSNAVKYSHKGGTVYCRLSRDGDGVLITVRDEGIGIPSADRNRIFETFHRASNVSHIGGLGLGLRIVRDYVKLHQGTIDLESEEGKGTTVTIRLPVQQVATPSA